MKYYTHRTRSGLWTLGPTTDQNEPWLYVTEHVDAHESTQCVPADYFDAEFVEFEPNEDLTIAVPLNSEELHFLYKLIEGDEELSDKFFRYYNQLNKYLGR